MGFEKLKTGFVAVLLVGMVLTTAARARAGEPTADEQLERMRAKLVRSFLERQLDDLDAMLAALKGLGLTPEQQANAQKPVEEMKAKYVALLAELEAGRVPDKEKLMSGPKMQEMTDRVAREVGLEKSDRLLRKLQSPRRDGVIWIRVLRANLASLNLTEEQKTKTERPIAAAAGELAKLADEAPADKAELDPIRAEFARIVKDLGTELGPMLTAEQKAELFDLMPGLAGKTRAASR
jgi:Skp family chaperone for outer membrane proteins